MEKFENFSILEVDFWVEPLKGQICSLVKVKSVDFLEKKIKVFCEGKARRKFFASGFVFERFNIVIDAPYLT
jgi:hypothetical protein